LFFVATFQKVLLRICDYEKHFNVSKTFYFDEIVGFVLRLLGENRARLGYL